MSKSSISKQSKFKIQKGDQIVVLAGKHRGESGKVNRIDCKKNRVFIEGLNIAKKHQKANAQGQGGIVDKVMSIHISNVNLEDPSKKVPTRIGYKIWRLVPPRLPRKTKRISRWRSIKYFHQDTNEPSRGFFVSRELSSLADASWAIR